MSKEIKLSHGYTADPPDKDSNIRIFHPWGDYVRLTREDLEKMLKLFEEG